MQALFPLRRGARHSEIFLQQITLAPWEKQLPCVTASRASFKRNYEHPLCSIFFFNTYFSLCFPSEKKHPKEQ